MNLIFALQTSLIILLMIVHQLRAPFFRFLELRATIVVNNFSFFDIFHHIFIGGDFEIEEIGILNGQLNEVILK